IYFLKKGIIEETLSRYLILFSIELALFIVLGLPFNIGAILHLILGYFIVNAVEIETESKIRTLLIMYFIDFVLYSLLSTYILPLNGIRFVAHPYLVYTLFNAATYAESKFFKTFSMISIIFLILLFLFNFGLRFSILNAYGENSIEDLRDGLLFFKRGTSEISNIFESISLGFQNIGQLFNISQYTYTGTQQESEKPQGVYLKEIKAGDYVYKEGMPIYISAILEARKIDTPFDVKVQCYTEKINDIGKKEKIYGYINQLGQTEKQIKVISGAETTIQCIFDKDTLPYGDYTITINASFEFTTESIKKIYLMDRDRMLNDYKLLSTKNIEPSKQAILDLYKINDANQPSIYTTGPVELSIGTENVPWDIGDENINPRFGLKIQNKWIDGGKISRLKTIYLKIPDTFNILENTCTGIAVEDVSSTDEEKEKSLKTYKIPVSDIGNIENQLTFICLMEIDKKALDKTPITTRYLKSQIIYDYELTKKIQLSIEKKPEVEIENSFQDETQNT
ncbi:MAG: hypothetical protein QW757_02065, partial [Candidatus Woesearchaeota archaeon]